MSEVVIEVGKRHIRAINEEIQAACSAGAEIVVRNTLSRHNLGIGLPAGRSESGRIELQAPELGAAPRHPLAAEPIEMVILTELTPESRLRAALAEIDTFEDCVAGTNRIRILEPEPLD